MRAGRGYPQVAESLLGELAATVTLIAGGLKGQGRLTLQLKGEGAISLLLVECDDELRLRGMARAGTCPPDATVPQLLGMGKGMASEGEGQLLMTLEQDTGFYQSIVPLAGETVAAIFNNYLTQSEQQDARLFLAANENVVAGLLLQKMPAADSMDADGWLRLSSLAATVRREELLDLEAESLLFRLFPEDAALEAGVTQDSGLLLFPKRSVSWHCPDNREKLTAMIKSWGREEAEAILAEQGVIEIQDEIGNKTYRFDADDVAAIFA
jgi:molecular chaperone Hsp33